MILSFFSCKGRDDFSKLLMDLQSTNDSVRFDAIEKLEKFKPLEKQSYDLLKKATNDFPSAMYEWESIPGKMVEIATKKPKPEFISIIGENFTGYDQFAKHEALRFLSNFNNIEAITLYKNLVINNHSEIFALPVGILDKDFKFGEIIFPDFLQLIENKNIDSDVLLLVLNYLKANELNVQDNRNYIDKLISLSREYRQLIIEIQKRNIDIWEDDEYQIARYKSGIIADLLGYINAENTITELQNYLKLNDNKLVMFATVSLLRLDFNPGGQLFERLAADTECRKWFYNQLEEIHKEGLFPQEYKTQTAFAESDMVNWLLYPTELGRMPDSIELMQVVEVDTNSVDGVVDFYLYRFKSDHESFKDYGWMAGISGYFPKKEQPLTQGYGYTFSSFEKWESKSAEEHIAEIKKILDEAYENNQ